MTDAKSDPIAWADLAAPAVRERAAAGAIALWPIGSTEQHGAHLATGFDLLAPAEICQRVASRLQPNVLVLPGLPFGCSEHWLALGATLSLKAQTLMNVVGDIQDSLRYAGFKHLVIVNGHAGNVGPSAAALGITARPELPRVEFVSYWELVDPQTRTKASVTDAGGIGHAGELETSIGLFLQRGVVQQPEDVQTAGATLDGGPGSARTVFLRQPAPESEAPEGVYGDPRSARAELGRLIVERATEELAEHCANLLEHADRSCASSEAHAPEKTSELAPGAEQRQ
jgi:creatinine amidohydrolase